VVVAPSVISEVLLEERHLNEELAAAARAMADQRGTSDTLDRALRAAIDIIDGCELAGVSVVTRGGIETLAATSDALRKIDQLQHDLEQGPCRDALRRHEVVTSGDLAHDERWPLWGTRIADELGILSCAGFRLFTTGKSIGAMTLYSRAADAFDDGAVADGQLLAAHVAVAYTASRREDQLNEAVSSRTTIGTALGVLMERYSLDSERAFEVLCRTASQTKTKLYVVAKHLVETGQLPGVDPDG